MSLDAALPAVFQDPQQQLSQQITRADMITARTTGPVDAEHIDVSGSLDAHLVQPTEGYRTSGLSYDTYVDVEPRSPATPSWGKKVQFNFGHEGKQKKK